MNIYMVKTTDKKTYFCSRILTNQFIVMGIGFNKKDTQEMKRELRYMDKNHTVMYVPIKTTENNIFLTESVATRKKREVKINV